MSNSVRAIGFVVCILLALAGVYAVYAVFNAQTAQINHLKAQVTQSQQCQKAAHEWQSATVANLAALNEWVNNGPTNTVATDIHTATGHVNAAKAYNCPGATGVNK